MEENQELKEKLAELQEFVSNNRDVREWKRGEAVRLRLLGVNYQAIKQRLGVSTSFIAQSQRKYKERGLAGLKLGYKGSKTYLTDEEKSEIMVWLYPRARRNISELERHLIETYDLVFLSRESYYQILRSSHLTWQKGNRENPRKNPEKVKEINEKIAKILKVFQTDIESEKLAGYALDECHLQGDDICSYLWGERENREIIKVVNERDRQTYYGALNLWTQEFIVSPYPTGNGENTVKFLQKIKKRHPEQRLLLIWDGASYHRGEEMKKLLAIENEEKRPEEWSITCQLFAPYAPAENPVEGIWLQVKNFIRRFYHICTNFSIVKRLFEFFFDFKLFNNPNLKKYDAFAQLI